MRLQRIPPFIRPFRVTKGRKFRLKDVDPANMGRLEAEQKEKSTEWLSLGLEELARMQEMLSAQDRWALLLVFQAMDAAGKDGPIKHEMSGVNPHGVQVFSFKQPCAEELDHDFLWRTHKVIPERGRIGIFNRSPYQETLVVRVHQGFLARQHMPPSLVTKEIWKERFEGINACERDLTRNGVVIWKFFLHVSKTEQKKRFLERIDDADKNWKLSRADARERDHGVEYRNAYEDTIRHTATPHAAWFVVPADNKGFTRLIVAAAVIDALAEMDLHFPAVDAVKRRELQQVKKVLEANGKRPKRTS